jgi:hypothetical protein
MLKKRDAQGLSTSVIILAVLGLIILFAMVYLFTQESGKTADTLASCFTKGGTCMGATDCKNEGGTEVPEFECKYKKDTSETSGVCCVKV